MLIEKLPNINFIKDDILLNINQICDINNIDINNDYNLIDYVYNYTYNDIMTYVELMLDFRTKCKIMSEFKDVYIDSNDNLNLYCCNLITESLYLEIYLLFTTIGNYFNFYVKNNSIIYISFSCSSFFTSLFIIIA